MDRRRFLLTSLVGALAAPLAAQAQQASGPPRIGYMAINLTAGDPRPLHAFFQGLRDLGYVEGKNLVIEYRDAAGKPDRSRDLSRASMRKNPPICSLAL
jgi:putative tryptophan/tyrosine transport system substrate-binding protein